MAAVAGSALFLQFGDASNILDTDFRAFSVTETGGVVDGSAGADTSRTYLTTLKDGTATATIIIQTADAAGWLIVVPGTRGTLLWSEEGSSTGGPFNHVQAFVTERRKSASYADLVVADVTWQFTSAVTASTYG